MHNRIQHSKHLDEVALTRPIRADKDVERAQLQIVKITDGLETFNRNSIELPCHICGCCLMSRLGNKTSDSQS